MSTTFDQIPDKYKFFFQEIGALAEIPGLKEMESGAVDFWDRAEAPSQEYGPVTELPWGLGWYRGTCDKVPYRELILTPKGWEMVQKE